MHLSSFQALHTPSRVCIYNLDTFRTPYTPVHLRGALFGVAGSLVLNTAEVLRRRIA